MPVPDLDPTARHVVSAAIRQRVRLSVGPNSREILDAGGTVALTPAECDDAAEAAFGVLADAGYAIVPIGTVGDHADLPEWVRNLRVSIRDTRASDGITPAGLTRYLAAAGWTRTAERVRVPAESWNLPTNPGRGAALVPLDASYADFDRRVIDLAEGVAEREGRGVIGVIADLRSASQAAAAAEPVTGQEEIDV